MVAPAERIDILIDFSKVAAGTKIILRNDAVTPFLSGDEVDPNTTGQVMQFTVLGTCPVIPPALPAVLNTLPVLLPNAPKRTLVLFEVEDPVSGQPVIVLLNGQRLG